MRAYLAYCQLEYVRDSKYEKNQLILVGILTTLCSTSRHDFLIFNKKMGAAGECELWKNGMQKMKDCYCKPGAKVDKQALIQHRNTWIGRNRFWYDPKRGIPRNTQNPGNYSPDYQRPNHSEETLKWKPIVGLRGGGVSSKAPADEPNRGSRTRSKTTIKVNGRQNPRGAERQKSKEQRQQNIQELNQWGLGNVKSKAASSVVKKTASSSSISTTTAMSKRKRESSGLLELEADVLHIPKRVSTQQPPLNLTTRTHRSQADDESQAHQQHRLSLLTIRRNAELEEARIKEEKRLQVLREESELESQRIKRLRQTEQQGNDLYVKVLKWLRLSSIIKNDHLTVAYEFDLGRKLDELRQLDSDKALKAKIARDKLQLLATLEMEKMQRLAREEEENRNLEKQRSERLFQAKLDERSDSLEHSREDRRSKLRAYLQERQRESAHERQMDHVNAKNTSRLTLFSLRNPATAAVKSHTKVNDDDENMDDEEMEENDDEEEVEDWMVPADSKRK